MSESRTVNEVKYWHVDRDSMVADGYHQVAKLGDVTISMSYQRPNYVVKCTDNEGEKLFSTLSYDVAQSHFAHLLGVHKLHEKNTVSS